VNAGLWEDSGVDEQATATAFAGRDAELDRLCDALGALDTMGARTVLIGGEAGIGKTRLVEEFRDRARAAGTLVAAGVCTPAVGGGLPYAPVVGVLRDLSRQLDEATAAAMLTPARQGLGLLDTHSAGPMEGVTTPSEMGKTRLFETLLNCFASLAERNRVVLVFEDLHWADSASVEVIDFLARNLGASPLLLIGTYRRDELEHDRSVSRMLAELGRHRAASQLDLAGLERDATAVLMAGILGHQPDWALLEAVHARCEGNPFFAEELTAARDATSLPAVLRNVIMLRVDRCTATARHVAAVVATALDRFPPARRSLRSRCGASRECDRGSGGASRTYRRRPVALPVSPRPATRRGRRRPVAHRARSTSPPARRRADREPRAAGRGPGTRRGRAGRTLVAGQRMVDCSACIDHGRRCDGRSSRDARGLRSLRTCRVGL
jgi:hypothetical protein